MNLVRTRYAPSPTGQLHVGGARTALFSYLYAKHFGGQFIVRIEDTDLKRNVANGEQSQLANLAWLGIIADESPLHPNPLYGKYRQSEKLVRYNAIIDDLVARKLAYIAWDTPQELLAQRAEQTARGIPSFRYNKNWLKLSTSAQATRLKAGHYAVRLAMPVHKIYAWNDLVRGQIKFDTADIGDFVIKKQDGYPTYNFAVVIDDHDMAISHVLRGEEHITNTPKQLALYDLLEWTAPQFGHLTIITNQAGKKLSKRDLSMHQFIADYRRDGYVPDAIFNFLALLGWSAKDAQEKMSQRQLINAFDPSRLSKSPTKFDLKKMAWFGKAYFKELAPSLLLTRLKASHPPAWMQIFIATYQPGAKNLFDLESALKLYQQDPQLPLSKAALLTQFPQVKLVLKTFIMQLKTFSIEAITNAIQATQTLTKIKGKNLFMPLRLVTTHQTHGPELAKAIYLFGETTIRTRCQNVLS